jgi:predicted PurR-regulated permease PerM
MFGTYIAGVFGLLIAVPVAGVIKNTIDAVSGEVGI